MARLQFRSITTAAASKTTVQAIRMIFPFFADAKNLVYTNSFDFSTIDNLEITLTYEQLQISRIYGNELLVEIGSNNIKKIPEVSCDQETLKITSKEEKYKRGDKCTVYLYIPQDFQAQSITIRNVSGNISADFLKAQNAVLLSNVSGRTDIGSCQTELFTCLSVSGNTSLQKIMVDYFEIGHIDNTHGLKGELKVRSYSTTIKRFEELKSILVSWPPV